MDHENSSPISYWYGLSEGYEVRCQRRLQNDLDVDEVGAEVILHLRSQVIELQSHIRQLEAELAEKGASQHLHLAHYRDVFFEATWIELEIQE